MLTLNQMNVEVALADIVTQKDKAQSRHLIEGCQQWMRPQTQRSSAGNSDQQVQVYV